MPWCFAGCISDPNRQDDPQYIVLLIGQVITVSLETLKADHGFPGHRRQGLQKISGIETDIQRFCPMIIS